MANKSELILISYYIIIVVVIKEGFVEDEELEDLSEQL